MQNTSVQRNLNNKNPRMKTGENCDYNKSTFSQKALYRERNREAFFEPQGRLSSMEVIQKLMPTENFSERARREAKGCSR